jgi:tetratricopeptide (TPR) repeat protein
MRIASRGLLGVLCAAALSTRGSADEPNLAQKVHAILKANCHRCHGNDGANEGGFNFVLDRQRLVNRKKIIPGDSAHSKLYKRLIHADDPMPPADEKPRPSKEDIALVKQWIDAGAPDFAATVVERKFLTPADVVQAIKSDLQTVKERDRHFTRYFTLTHLFNSGLSADEMQSYRHGLSKLTNSLSWGPKIVVPKAVDAERTVFRIDLRDFQWNERVWETVVSANPYGVRLPGEDFDAVCAMTECKLPYVRGDWFVAAASRPPLYHEVLQLPKTERELEALLRIDTRENIRQERVARAGFNGSGVSKNNRLIERHEAGSVVYWKSYDFASNTGRQNLFAHPLGPGDTAGDFRPDGGEVIFNLPNGLQGYFLATGAGNRLDKGPTAIVSDPRRPDRAVENGLSCMSCHHHGMIEKNDQVRDHVLKNGDAFTKADLETIKALYPPRPEFAELLKRDARRFQEAVAATGAPLSATEPIAALALRFEAELDLPLAAAEVGVKPDRVLQALELSADLAKRIGSLRIEGGTVQRQVFVDAFEDLVRTLKLGEFVEPKVKTLANWIRLGHKSLNDGNVAAAVKAFTEAVALDAENAELRVARADALREARDFDRAIEDYDLAVRLRPLEPSTYHGRGDAYFGKRDFERAVTDYDEALRLDSKNAVTWNNRGLALHRLGRSDRALADFAEALRLDPKYAMAHYNRGTVFHRQGRHDKARADYTEAIRLNPKMATAFNNRGLSYHEERDFNKAVADFTDAIKLDAKLAVAWLNRGLSRNQQRKFDDAIADFSEAIRLDPKLARAYFHRAIAHEQKGETAKAADDKATALKLDATLRK